MVAERRHSGASLLRARSPAAAWPRPEREAKTRQLPSRCSYPAARSPLPWAPGDPALRLPDLGLAERLKQSWVHRSTYQAVGKGVSSPSPRTAPQPPCAPFDLCTRSREREGKDSVGHWRHHLGWGAGNSPPPPYTPGAASSPSYMKPSKTTDTQSTKCHKMHRINKNCRVFFSSY